MRMLDVPPPCRREHADGVAHFHDGPRRGPVRPPLGPSEQLGAGRLHVDTQRFGRSRRRRGGGLALEIEELDHQLRAGRTVEQCMVDLHDHPGATAGQTLDDVQLPQRTAAVEGAAEDVGDDGFEVGGSVRDAVIVGVHVDIEPVGLGVAQPRIGQSLAQRREIRQAPPDQLRQRADRGGTWRGACVEHGCPRHVQVVRGRLHVQERRVETAEALHPTHPNAGLRSRSRRRQRLNSWVSTRRVVRCVPRCGVGAACRASPGPVGAGACPGWWCRSGR